MTTGDWKDGSILCIIAISTIIPTAIYKTYQPQFCNYLVERRQEKKACRLSCSASLMTKHRCFSWCLCRGILHYVISSLIFVKTLTLLLHMLVFNWKPQKSRFLLADSVPGSVLALKYLVHAEAKLQPSHTQVHIDILPGFSFWAQPQGQSQNSGLWHVL